MHLVLVTCGLIVALAVCHAGFVYPDEYESMKVAWDRRRPVNPPRMPVGYYPSGSQSYVMDREVAAFRNPNLNKEPPRSGQVEPVPAVGHLPPMPDYEPLGPSPPQNPGSNGPLPKFLLPGDPKPVQPLSQPPFGNNGGPRGPRPPPPSNLALPAKWRNHVINVISNGVTKLSLDMDRILDTESHKNVLFSPINLTFTLALILLASSGKTFEEVAKVLGLESGFDVSNHSEIVHQVFGYLMQQFDSDYLRDNTLPECKVAFSLFVQDGFPIRPEFRAISDNVYKSDVVNTNFGQTRVSQTMINNWVKQKTNGKIKKMLEQAPDPTTLVAIISALYFHGDWSRQFGIKETSRKPFNIGGNKTTYVDMMVNMDKFPYFSDRELGLDIVALPYKGEKVKMYVVVPISDGADALKKTKEKLTPAIIDDLISKMWETNVIVGLPKMKLSSTIELQSAFRSLGVNSLFDPSANLGVLSPGAGTNVETNMVPPPRESSRSLGGGRGPSSFVPSTRWKPRNCTNGYQYRTQNYTVHQCGNGLDLSYSPQPVKREVRPVDKEFANYLNSNFPPFGVDELRKSPRLGNPGLFAQTATHKVKMTVNEKGTEAAAATSVLMGRSALMRAYADKPFLFFVRHDDLKLIWFWGSIYKPTPFFESP